MPSFRASHLAGLGVVLLFGCGGGSGDLSGTYQAKDAQGSMTIEFKSGHKFHMTMQEGTNPQDSADGDYLVNGNQITLQVPNGMPLVLTRNGKVLEANMMGQVMHFEKQ